jgi:hypothetical protein
MTRRPARYHTRWPVQSLFRDALQGYSVLGVLKSIHRGDTESAEGAQR